MGKRSQEEAFQSACFNEEADTMPSEVFVEDDMPTPKRQCSGSEDSEYEYSESEDSEDEEPENETTPILVDMVVFEYTSFHTMHAYGLKNLTEKQKKILREAYMTYTNTRRGRKACFIMGLLDKECFKKNENFLKDIIPSENILEEWTPTPGQKVEPVLLYSFH